MVSVKMCDMSKCIAASVFQKLNASKVTLKEDPFSYYEDLIIVTDVEPSDLVYPEGWYYANGNFRNKYNSTTGMYEEVRMVDSTGESWAGKATYCTKDISK